MTITQSIKPLSIKERQDCDEKFLQEYIAQHPEVLGLGEIELHSKERIVQSGGRLDLRSWEHCYKVFYDARLKRKKGETPDYDYLSLHLAFYLASWGMYHGSSFLLQQDYKVHEGATIEIMKDKYDPLQGATCKEVGENLDLLFELVKELQVHYEGIRIKTNGHKRTELSATLITKILMGTLGCTPAYDRFFLEGIKGFKGLTGVFNKQSISRLIDFYKVNSEPLESARREMRIDGLEYPQMKLLDMGFWQIGKEEDDKRRERLKGKELK